MKQYFFSVFIVLFLISDIWAQTAKIYGKVFDENSKTALAGANVSIKGTQKGTITDANGEFGIENVNNGTMILNISFIGYQSVTRNINMISGESVNIEISLKRLILPLQEIKITSNDAYCDFITILMITSFQFPSF